MIYIFLSFFRPITYEKSDLKFGQSSAIVQLEDPVLEHGHLAQIIRSSITFLQDISFSQHFYSVLVFE